MNLSEQPIGIFDSGIGGLTVASAIAKLLPHENLLYFGDTAHLPYGDKSPELIQKYSEGITHFLLEKKVKMIVIACNTASSLGYAKVREICGPDFPVINVIDPTVEFVVQEHEAGKIGVIATKGTVKSKIYQTRLHEKQAELKVEEVATQLLAPMIEEGFFNNNISQTIINSYLSNHRLKGIRMLILGCTHYPLIMPEIQRFYKGKVQVIDSANRVAEAVKLDLETRNLVNSSQKEGRVQCFVSDYTAAFQKSTRLFFGNKIRLEPAMIWKNA